MDKLQVGKNGLLGEKNLWDESIHGSLFCGLMGHGLKRLGVMSLGETARGRNDVGVMAVHQHKHTQTQSQSRNKATGIKGNLEFSKVTEQQ